MTQNALNWFEIHTNDIEKASSFYSEILATKLDRMDSDCGKIAMLPHEEGKGVGGAVIEMDMGKPGPGGTIVYLNVDGDLDGVITRIPQAGGKILKERFEIPPHGFIAIFEDPEGNIIGLHSMS